MVRETGGDGSRAVLQMQSVRGMAQVLQAIKSGGKQPCSISINSDGLTVRWEDESKALQASVFFKKELFTRFDIPEEAAEGGGYLFGVQLSLLLDTLGVFASAPGQAGVLMTYPGPQGELVLEMYESEGGPEVVTYARLGPVELPAGAKDLSDYWEGRGSYFLAHGAMLKEVIEDLEWPSAGAGSAAAQRGSVEVSMWAPRHERLALSAMGEGGALTVDIPVSQLSGFSVVPAPAHQRLPQPGQAPDPDVRWVYKLKAMRTAFCSLPSSKDPNSCSTKVSVDDNGLLKVTHMVTLPSGPGGPGAQAPAFNPVLGAHRFGGDGLGDSQRHGGDSGAAVVTYVMVPCVEGLD